MVVPLHPPKIAITLRVMSGSRADPKQARTRTSVSDITVERDDHFHCPAKKSNRMGYATPAEFAARCAGSTPERAKASPGFHQHSRAYPIQSSSEVVQVFEASQGYGFRLALLRVRLMAICRPPQLQPIISTASCRFGCSRMTLGTQETVNTPENKDYPAGIRTPTDRTKTCCATITPPGRGRSVESLVVLADRTSPFVLPGEKTRNRGKRIATRDEHRCTEPI